VAIELSPNQPAQLSLPDRDQALQRPVFPRVASRHENFELSAVDDDLWCEPAGSAGQDRSSRLSFHQELIERCRVTHPKAMSEDFGSRLGPETNYPAQASTPKAQAWRGESGLGSDTITVDPDIEGTFGPVPTAQERRVTENRLLQYVLEIGARRVALEHDLGALLRRNWFEFQGLELPVEAHLPPLASKRPGSHDDFGRVETKHRPKTDAELTGGPGTALLGRGVERKEVTLRMLEGHPRTVITAADALAPIRARGFEPDPVRTGVACVLQ
jgi:hypothetical protein